MGEKKNFTLFIGDSAMSALSEMPEPALNAEPEVEINDMEDFIKVLHTGSDGVIIPCKFTKRALIKLRWIFWKAHVKSVLCDLRQKIKRMFSKEAL